MRAVICFQSAIGAFSGRIVAARESGCQCRQSKGRKKECSLWLRIQHKSFYTLTTHRGVSILELSPLGEAMARLRDLSRIAAAVVSSLGLIVAPLSNAAT